MAWDRVGRLHSLKLLNRRCHLKSKQTRLERLHLFAKRAYGNPGQAQ